MHIDGYFALDLYLMGCSTSIVLHALHLISVTGRARFHYEKNITTQLVGVIDKSDFSETEKVCRSWAVKHTR